MANIRFLDENGTFTVSNPENVSGLYFPLAGEAGLKSAIAPNLGGDCKLDQESFLLEPVSVEDLHNRRGTRNFWCVTEEGCWSAAGVSAEQEAARFTGGQDQGALTAGPMWQTVERETARYDLQASITSFVPPRENVEVMAVQVTNTGTSPRRVTGVAAVPIYARSADNLRDHRNVTSMLHRIRTGPHGVLVKPTMSFDEKGHRENHRIYYVLGSTGDGERPAAFYPSVDRFLGEGGTFLRPRAVYERAEGVPAGTEVDGREAMGGIRFPAVTLKPGQSTLYIVLMGIAEDRSEMDRVLSSLRTAKQAEAALAATKAHWLEQVNVRCHTGSPEFDRWMRRVSFQPFLRRLYGCSFLPHHDYGRGGRGWRDLWQDCLSLLLMDPDGVGEQIRANFGGVRMDGTNATIIGEGLGNFIADRNGIARVWMDHALWPLMTTRLYIDQTGDLDILLEVAPYFKDPQVMRGTEVDGQWTADYGNRQRTASGEVYTGSILEHLLSQHLAAFACNNKETNRKYSDSRLSQRALREIYLRPFEIIVHEAEPWAIMSSYNVINGRRASESRELLTDILREEWGYTGLVMTDWWTRGEQYKEILAGNDLKMANGYPERVREAMALGAVGRKDLEVCARRVLELILKID